MLCENCIKFLVNNLNSSEILLLQELHNKKRINNQTGLDKNKLLTLSKDLTQYKLNSVIERLTLIGFLTRTPEFPAKYYISQDGIKALELYKEQFK